MSSKKSKKSNKSDETKRNVQTKKKASEKHSKEEIISKEELDNRIAIDGDIRLYLTVLLKIFIDGHFHHPKKKKLIIWPNISMTKKYYTFTNTAAIS